MFNEKFVVSVKSKNKILREFKDTVYLPYGEEYSIYLKNLNSVRAVANITIDGVDVVPGGLVVNANTSIDLERFVKDFNKGNRFKFIERTASIENHRGVGAEDGLIRVEFQFEMPVIRTPGWALDLKSYPPYSTGYPYHYWNQTEQWSHTADPGVKYKSSSESSLQNVKPSKGMLRSANIATAASLNSVVTSSACDSYVPQNEAGITVPGSVSEQKFVTAENFPLDPQKHVIVLKLLGETEENLQIRQPVTVKHKPRCVTCGKQNKATAKFCIECGTALHIYA